MQMALGLNVLMYTVCRASFTWWITIVQLICFIVTMSVYGVATVGGLTTTIRDEVGWDTRGHSMKLNKHHCSIDATKYYFSNRVVNAWNSLPGDTVSAPTVSAFKRRSLLFVFLHSTIICVLFFFLCLICVVYSVYFCVLLAV